MQNVTYLTQSVTWPTMRPVRLGLVTGDWRMLALTKGLRSLTVPLKGRQRPPPPNGYPV